MWAERDALKGALLDFVRHGEGDFDALAGRLARWQAQAIGPYGQLAQARGWELGWREAPLVPTALFRELDLRAPVQESDAAVFKTSGTTGAGLRGTRRVPDLTLYHAAMEAPFVEHVLAGDRTPRLWWSLIPDTTALPESSLSHMTSALAERLATEVVVERPTENNDPVVVMTTSFAIVQHLDAADPGLPPLPPGSRMMLTGGFKGKSRELDESALLALIEERLGLSAGAVVPEYGMTELTSQAYGRPLEGPPWLKLRVVAPGTQRDVVPGEQGLVAFFDLLNLDNVSAILTSDLGTLDAEGRLTLHGRAPGAVLRGCSLTAEELGLGA